MGHEEDAQRPAATLRRLVNGYQISQAIHVAAVLGIADLLRDGPESAERLAEATSTDAPTLVRLLRALASVGVLHERDDGTFALTDVGTCLRSDAPEPLVGWAAFIGAGSYRAAWGGLLDSVRTGTNAFRRIFGMDVWEYRRRHPEEGAAFDRAMTALTRTADRALMDAYDFGTYRTVIDVGGGTGALLAALLTRYPEMRAVLFDRPSVVASPDALASAGVLERCRVVSGDFFQAVPGGGDAYLLKLIIHDWQDPEAIAILRECHRAAPSDASVLVIERELGGPNERPDAKFSDLNMLVAAGGRERTEPQYAELFAAAGLRMVRAVPTASGHVVMEAVAA